MKRLFTEEQMREMLTDAIEQAWIADDETTTNGIIASILNSDEHRRHVMETNLRNAIHTAVQDPSSTNRRRLQDLIDGRELNDEALAEMWGLIVEETSKADAGAHAND